MKVIIYNIFGLGHINPTLALTKKLIECGHQVIYHSSPERKELIESTGAEFRNYGRDDYKAADYNPGKNFVLQTLPASLGLLPFLEAEINKEKPDLILYDSMAIWGRIISHIHHIPSICLVTTKPLSKEEKQLMFQQHGVMPDELNLSILKKLEENHGLKLDFESVLGAYHDCNLVFAAKELGDGHGECFHYMGSPKRTETLDEFPLEQILKRKRKVITMALGTLLPEEHPSVFEWYKCLLRAFASDERFQIILGTGTEKVLKSLGPLAPNVIARSQIPQLEVLKHTSVFIHHGGMNSLSEGLAAGVPMVIIPHSHDQYVNARKASKLGVAKEIQKELMSEDLIRKEVLDAMFSPSIQRSVQKIKVSMMNAQLGVDPLTIMEKRLS